MEKNNTRTLLISSKILDKTNEYNTPAVFMNIIQGFHTTRHIKDYKYTQQMHRHSYYELQYIMEGVCHFETDDNQIITVSEGEFILFSPGIKHRISYESEKFNKFSLTFSMTPKDNDTPNFYRFAQKKALIPVTHKATPQTENLIENMIINSKEKNQEYSTITYHSTISLIIEILRIIVGNEKIESTVTSVDTRVNTAIEYIKSNISASLNVDMVAKHLHISSKQLVRIFKKELNTTPGAYIKNHRIKYINDLLIGDFYMEEIANFMGYSDVTSLIKAYKRSEGTTPAKYKKSIKR